MSTTTKSCSALTMAKKYSVNRKTAWLFMHKVRKAMASSTRYPIAGTCEVDEAVLGEQVSGKRGIGAQKKKKVCVVIEKAEKGAKKVDTDEYKVYLPLIKEWNIVQTKSVTDVNFNLMHRFIQQLKDWLRGVHASKKYLQAYLDAYCYRLNRHRSINSIFDNAIKRRIAHKPVEHKLLALS